MGSCSLFLDEKEIGRANWGQEGGKAILWASCPFEDKYIYRLNIKCAEDNIPIGVMMPQEGRFTIKTKLSSENYKLILKTKQENIRGVIWRSLPGEKNAHPLPFAFSELRQIDITNVQNAQNSLLQLAYKDKLLYNKNADKHYIVFKLAVGKELDLSPLFCFITPVYMPDGVYGAICMDKAGMPIKIN